MGQSGMNNPMMSQNDMNIQIGGGIMNQSTMNNPMIQGQMNPQMGQINPQMGGQMGQINPQLMGMAGMGMLVW